MKVTREQSKYPYYGKSEFGTVVKFTKEGMGFPILDPENKYFLKLQTWSEEAFTPIPDPFEEEKFEPITITLETEEEALAMWLKLATNHDCSKNKASEHRLFYSLATGQSLLYKFDEVFDPLK